MRPIEPKSTIWPSLSWVTSSTPFWYCDFLFVWPTYSHDMALFCISLNFSKRLPWPKESMNVIRLKTNALNGGSAKDTRRRTCAVYLRILLGCSCLLLQRHHRSWFFFSPLFRFNLFQFTCLPCWPLKFEGKRVASSWNSCCRSHSLIGLSIAPNAVFFKADYCCRQDVHVITQSDVIVYLLYKRRRRSGRTVGET